MSKKKHELVIKSDPINLKKARKFVEILAKQYGFTEDEIFDIKVATGEAVSNSIEHGSPLGQKNSIKIITDFTNNKICISVVDQGIYKVPKKIDADPKHRGHGIPFMLALMDTVTVKEGKNGTTVKLVKKLLPKKD